MKNREINIHEYVLNKAENYQKRYIEAERFLSKLISMPWYKVIYYRLFQMDEDIIEFIRSRNKFEK